MTLIFIPFKIYYIVGLLVKYLLVKVSIKLRCIKVKTSTLQFIETVYLKRKFFRFLITVSLEVYKYFLFVCLFDPLFKSSFCQECQI